MLRIERLPFGASNCAVLPYKAQDKDGFIDTGNELLGLDPHVYVSATAVKEMARLFGWSPPEEVQDLQMRLDMLAGELEDTLEELQTADGYLNALDTLKLRGAIEVKRSGRPKTTQPEKAA